MPCLTLSCTAAGPTVSVAIAPSALLRDAMMAAGVQPPQPVIGTFLVDTGASHTVVDSKLIAQLGVNPTGAVMVHTPSTAGSAVLMPQYDLMLFVPGVAGSGGWLLDGLQVTAAVFDGQPIDGLIGRDILDRGMLVYNGQANHFTLAY